MGASYLGMRQCVREEGWGLRRNEREKKKQNTLHVCERRTKEEGNETSRVLEHHHSIVKPP